MRCKKTDLEELTPYLGSGKTIVFLGSSGVGKSTLMNALSGSDLRKTGTIHEDDGTGRNTTTTRHLSILADGTALIDTPGLREIRGPPKNMLQRHSGTSWNLP